jgi:hypothetical protein
MAQDDWNKKNENVPEPRSAIVAAIGEQAASARVMMTPLR